jgi:hypothetical protein
MICSAAQPPRQPPPRPPGVVGGPPCFFEPAHAPAAPGWSLEYGAPVRGDGKSPASLTGFPYWASRRLSIFAQQFWFMQPTLFAFAFFTASMAALTAAAAGVAVAVALAGCSGIALPPPPLST